MKREIKRFVFKGATYSVITTAYSLNDGEYYVARKTGDDSEKNVLIPADSKEIHRID